MKKIALLVLIACDKILLSQSVEIGQDAANVKSMVEYKVNSYYQANGPHTVKMNTDTRYINGKISDVLLCYENQYRMDIKLISSFCEHYLMTGEKLSSIVTQYEKVSLQKLEEIYGVIYGDKKIEKYYFNVDYKRYRIIFLASNGYASVEEKNTDLKELPSNVKQFVEKKLIEINNIEKAKELERTKKLDHEKEIKSKIYNIKELKGNLNSGLYSRLKREQQIKISECMKESAGNLTDDYLKKTTEKHCEFSNTYSVYYKLIDKSTPSIDNGNYIKAGSKNIDCTSNFSLVSGSDTSCKYISRCKIQIPTVYIENIEVMTEMFIDQIKVEYLKGISKVRIRDGKVEYLENEPPANYKEYVSNELAKIKNGKYYIRYEYINVMGDPEIKVDFLSK